MNTFLLFDVDGTLTKSMLKIDQEMIDILKKLKEKQYLTLAIVGGSDLKKISYQLGDAIYLFDHIFTENGLEYYNNKLDLIQSTRLNDYLGEENLQRLINFILLSLCEINLPYKRGTFIEYRTGMLNVSPIGRNCSQEERNAFELYDKQNNVRKKLIDELKHEFEDMDLKFSIGGQISFDVFPSTWDKTFCLQFIKKNTDIHFFGDKTDAGGNDYEIFNHIRVSGNKVKNYKDTIKILKDKFLT